MELASHAKISTKAAQSLELSLGPQVTHLTTHAAAFLDRLSDFSALQSIEVTSTHNHKWTTEGVQKLCQHPSVRSVTLKAPNWSRHGSDQLIGDFKETPCGWETLILDGVKPSVMAAMPLASVKQIVIQTTCHDMHCEGDRTALKNVMAEHGSKVICSPGPAARGGPPEFRVYGLWQESILLVEHIQEPCTVHLLYKVESQELLCTLWGALPACVHTVILTDVFCYDKDERRKGLDWSQLWTCLPETVTMLELFYCDVPIPELKNMIAAAPTHIRTMRLIPQSEARGKWATAGLEDSAPAHVTLLLE